MQHNPIDYYISFFETQRQLCLFLVLIFTFKNNIYLSKFNARVLLACSLKIPRDHKTLKSLMTLKVIQNYLMNELDFLSTFLFDAYSTTLSVAILQSVMFLQHRCIIQQCFMKLLKKQPNWNLSLGGFYPPTTMHIGSL